MKVLIAPTCHFSIPPHHSRSRNMSSKLRMAGAVIAAAASAHAEFTEPTVTGDVAFLETFTDGLGSWSGSKDDKYNGKWVRLGNERYKAQGSVTRSRCADNHGSCHATLKATHPSSEIRGHHHGNWM